MGTQGEFLLGGTARKGQAESWYWAWTCKWRALVRRLNSPEHKFGETLSSPDTGGQNTPLG